jgi:peptidoglycan/xylan/chitin deacetylase (PgdA/CDA1 family)
LNIAISTHIFCWHRTAFTIANQLGLQTVVWGYDSFDWRVGIVVGNATITQADVDADYGLFISNMSAGSFNAVGGIVLTHGLNDFTMQEAINWYARLKGAFPVQCTPLSTS